MMTVYDPAKNAPKAIVIKSRKLHLFGKKCFLEKCYDLKACVVPIHEKVKVSLMTHCTIFFCS